MEKLDSILNTIQCIDALEGLKNLPDNSIHLCITSPPYSDIRKSYQNISPQNYVNWFLPIGEQILRSLTPDGSFILNIKDKCEGGERIPYGFDLILRLREKGFKVIDTLVWVKQNGLGSVKAKRGFDYFEYIFHLGKSTNICWRPDEIRTPYASTSKKRSQKPIKINASNREARIKNKNLNYKVWTLNERGAYPKNVLYFKKDQGQDHVAAFDISLPTHFIKANSLPGNIILDPFCGRGTTCQAVVLLNQENFNINPRQYIGFEIDKTYVDLAKTKYGLNIK